MDTEPYLNLTYNDRRFLRQIYIDPEESTEQCMADALCDTYRSTIPDAYIISAELARAIIREYGELTIETIKRYRGTRGI